MCSSGAEGDPRCMNIVEVTDLTKHYGSQTAVDGVSFSVEEGEIFGILGPNGAGKTTTVESIAGLRKPDGGTIRVLGLDPQQDRDRLRQVVGVQLQESELPDRMTVSRGRRAVRVVLRGSGRSRSPDRRPRADREARHAVPEPVRRPEAAPLDRARPRRQAEGRDPRRAVDGPRPAGSPRDVAPHRVDPRPGRHRPPRHPPDGGGRAPRRPGRRHRWRSDHRDRHAGRHRLPRRRGAEAPIPPIGADRGSAADRPARR